jgi:hypothetical protein
MTSGGNQPNLAECAASNLALYLLEHRFSVSSRTAVVLSFDRPGGATSTVHPHNNQRVT